MVNPLAIIKAIAFKEMEDLKDLSYHFAQV